MLGGEGEEWDPIGGWVGVDVCVCFGGLGREWGSTSEYEEESAWLDVKMDDFRDGFGI